MRVLGSMVFLLMLVGSCDQEAKPVDQRSGLQDSSADGDSDASKEPAGAGGKEPADSEGKEEGRGDDDSDLPDNLLGDVDDAKLWIDLSWNANDEDGLAAYRIYVKGPESEQRDLVTEIALTQTGFDPNTPKVAIPADTTKSVKKFLDKEACFVVTALGAAGESEASSARCATLR